MKTQNYHLRPIQDSDIENIFKGLSDPEITKYYDVHFPTLEATKEQMEWYAKLQKDGTGIWWGIYGNDDSQFRGTGGFCDLSKEHQRAEIGLWLLKEYWGQGILKEVMPELFNYGFNDLGLNRIEGYVVDTNKKCKSALAKINFTHEGTMREYEFKDGGLIDVAIFAILKKEWLKSQQDDITHPRVQP